MDEPQEQEEEPKPPTPRESRVVKNATAGGQLRPLLIGMGVVVGLAVVIVVAGRYDRRSGQGTEPPEVTPGRIEVEGAAAPVPPAPAPKAGAGTEAGTPEAAPQPPMQFYEVLAEGRKEAAAAGGQIEMRPLPLPPPPDAAKPTAERAGQDRAARPEPPAPASEAAPKSETAPEPQPPAEAAEAEAEARSEPEAAKAAPAPAAPAAGTAKARPYTLQVGSFSERDGADELVQRLGGQGYEAYLMEVNLGSKGTWWRVRVGRYPTEYAAKWARLELVKEGLSPIVVRDRAAP